MKTVTFNMSKVFVDGLLGKYKLSPDALEQLKTCIIGTKVFADYSNNILILLGIVIDVKDGKMTIELNSNPLNEYIDNISFVPDLMCHGTIASGLVEEIDISKVVILPKQGEKNVKS